MPVANIIVHEGSCILFKIDVEKEPHACIANDTTDVKRIDSHTLNSTNKMTQIEKRATSTAQSTPHCFLNGEEGRDLTEHRVDGKNQKNERCSKMITR